MKYKDLRIERPGPEYLAVVVNGEKRIASFIELDDAERFVRAVNAHEELLETLKYIVQYIVDVDGDSQNGTVVLSTESWNAVLATITKAEGK